MLEIVDDLRRMDVHTASWPHPMPRHNLDRHPAACGNPNCPGYCGEAN